MKESSVTSTTPGIVMSGCIVMGNITDHDDDGPGNTA